MAQALFGALTTSRTTVGGFLRDTGLGELPAIDGILFSGGVSEYIYSREAKVFGDLGPYLQAERFVAKRNVAVSIFSKRARASAPPSSARRSTPCN